MGTLPSTHVGQKEYTFIESNVGDFVNVEFQGNKISDRDT